MKEWEPIAKQFDKKSTHSGVSIVTVMNGQAKQNAVVRR